MLRLAIAIPALTMFACIDDPPSTRVPPEGAPPGVTAAKATLPPWEGHRALPMLPYGAAPSQPWLAAVALWHTATSAYALGDAGASAEAFLAAAAKLEGGEPEPIARTFTAGRCLAYENAARAYAAAEMQKELQAKLTALAAGDPGCKHSIEAALAGTE